jgi:hypothetical protein
MLLNVSPSNDMSLPVIFIYGQGGSIHRANTARKIVEGGGKFSQYFSLPCRIDSIEFDKVINQHYRSSSQQSFTALFCFCQNYKSLVAVMGHVGLTPQAISVIGGFRAQGRTAVRARQLLDDALRLQDAGCFSIVLECVPANVATAITETLEVPTIGIGAGGGTSGQVLVFHDMLGMLSHPHHQQFVPKFCKKYAQVGHAIQEGLSNFKDEVESGVFPGEEYSPYLMSDGEKEAFDALLDSDAEERRLQHDVVATKLCQADEFEALKLYGANNKNDEKTE